MENLAAVLDTNWKSIILPFFICKKNHELFDGLEADSIFSNK